VKPAHHHKELTMTGPKITATPGEVPDLPAHPRDTASEPRGPGALPGALVKDLRKHPTPETAHKSAEEQQAEQRKLKTDVPPEARTEAEALELANAKGRAVMGPKGWVCPSTVQVRTPVAS